MSVDLPFGGFLNASAHLWKDKDGCRWFIQLWWPHRSILISRLGVSHVRVKP